MFPEQSGEEVGAHRRLCSDDLQKWGLLNSSGEGNVPVSQGRVPAHSRL